MKIKKKFFLAITIAFLSAFPAQAEKKLAVIPFSVPENYPEMQQFGIGTAESITIALSKVPDFVMIDRHQLKQIMAENAFQQSGFVDEQTAVQAGKLIGAQILILGSIQYDGNNYRISAKLTEVETGKIVKAIQATGKNIFAVQDQLASSILSENKVSLSEIMKKKISDLISSTKNTDAYDYYIRGRNELLNADEDGYKKAVYWFNQALEVDPEYQLAMASKAESLALFAFARELQGKPYLEIIENAEKTARLSLNGNQELAETHRALSSIYKIRGMFNESSEEAEKALKINPNDPESYYLLWSNGNKDLNDPLIKKAVSINPFIVMRHLAFGYALYKKGKYQEAIDVFKEVNFLNPKIAKSYAGLGFAYYKKGKNQVAFDSFLEAKKLDKKSADVYTGMGLIHFSEGRIEQAFKEFKLAQMIDKKYSYAYSGLGYIYYLQGEKDKAVSLYQEAIELNPDDFYALNGLGFYFYEKNENEQAMKYYEQVLRINPNDPDVYYNLGLLYRKMGLIKEAEESFLRTIEISPFFERYYFPLIGIYESQKNYEQALAIIETGLEQKPESSSLLTKKGLIYQLQGKIFAAEQCYQQILKIAPQDINAINNLGTIYFSRGDLNGAIEKFQTVLKISPEDPNANDNLGLSFHKLGNYQEALKYYRKSCKFGKKETCEWLKQNNYQLE